MTNRLWITAAAGLALLVAFSVRAKDAKEAKEPSEDEKALHDRATAMIAAFNKGDAKALAEFWTPDGDYTDEVGNHYKGRKEIEESFEKLFAAGKGAELRVHPRSRRLIRPDVAIIDGEMEVIPPGGGLPTTARYTTVNVKQDGEWLIESVREAPAVAPSHGGKLDALEWLIGSWADEGEKGPGTKLSFAWAENNNFIVGSYTTTLKEVPVSGATQWIGWDEAQKKVRSWSFDSTGGFSEATWTRDGDRRVSKTTMTLRDGKKLTSTNVVTRIDADHITWQSTNRSLEGKELPDTREVKLKRVQEE